MLSHFSVYLHHESLYAFLYSTRLLACPAVHTPHSCRLLLGLWMLFGQVLSMGYSGNLISYMTEPGREPAVDTLIKLSREVRRSRFTCGMIRDAAEHVMLKVSSTNKTCLRQYLSWRVTPTFPYHASFYPVSWADPAYT